MTVIVAALTGEHVTVAADSEVVNGWDRQRLDSSKLWTAEQHVLGGSGALRAAQVLRHHVTWPRYRPDEDTDWERYLVTTVVPAIRGGAADKGVVRNISGVESIGLSLIIAARQHIGIIAGDGSVLVARAQRAAIGSGYAQALGRLGEDGPWTEDDVIDAVRRAAQTAHGVGGPITVSNTSDLTVRTVGGAS